jgi:hypothetical protein
VKTCFKCGVEQPLAELYKHPMMGDGHLNKCKACARADSVKQYHGMAEDPEWINTQRQRGRDKYHRLYRRLPRERGVLKAPDPLKRKARVALGNAVRDGRVTKPESCQACGEGGRIEGHHTDYNLPLDVMWLCTLCHGKQHRKEAA